MISPPHRDELIKLFVWGETTEKSTSSPFWSGKGTNPRGWGFLSFPKRKENTS
jgi:hypothetical protein